MHKIWEIVRHWDQASKKRNQAPWQKLSDVPGYISKKPNQNQEENVSIFCAKELRNDGLNKRECTVYNSDLSWAMILKPIRRIIGSNFIFSDHFNCIQRTDIASIALLFHRATKLFTYLLTFRKMLVILYNPKFSCGYHRALIRARGFQFQAIQKRRHWSALTSWKALPLTLWKGLGLNVVSGLEMENSCMWFDNSDWFIVAIGMAGTMYRFNTYLTMDYKAISSLYKKMYYRLLVTSVMRTERGIGHEVHCFPMCVWSLNGNKIWEVFMLWSQIGRVISGWELWVENNFKLGCLILNQDKWKV